MAQQQSFEERYRRAMNNPAVRDALSTISKLESNDDPYVLYGGDRYPDLDRPPWKALPEEAFELDSQGRRTTAFGLYQINQPTLNDFQEFADPNRPLWDPENQHRMAYAILENTGVVNERGALHPAWMSIPAVHGRWEAIKKGYEEGKLMPYKIPHGGVRDMIGPANEDQVRRQQGVYVTPQGDGTFKSIDEVNRSNAEFWSQKEVDNFQPAKPPRGPLDISLPDSPTLNFDTPHVAMGKMSSDGPFEPDPDTLAFAEKIANISADFGDAKDVIKAFQSKDFAPQMPLPPVTAGASGSFLGALFRGLGGEQAVQNDAAMVQNAVQMINQAALANLKQQGYKTMRDADMARALASVEQSEEVQRIESARAALMAKIDAQEGAADANRDLKTRLALLEWEQKQRNSFGEWASDPERGGATLAGLDNAIAQMDVYDLKVEDVDLGNGDVGTMYTEDQTRVFGTDEAGEPIELNLRSARADRALKMQYEANLEAIDRAFAPYLATDAGQKMKASYIAKLDRKYEDVKKAREMGQAFWQARYRPSKDPENRFIGFAQDVLSGRVWGGGLSVEGAEAMDRTASRGMGTDLTAGLASNLTAEGLGITGAEGRGITAPEETIERIERAFTLGTGAGMALDAFGGTAGARRGGPEAVSSERFPNMGRFSNAEAESIYNRLPRNGSDAQDAFAAMVPISNFLVDTLADNFTATHLSLGKVPSKEAVKNEVRRAMQDQVLPAHMPKQQAVDEVTNRIMKRLKRGS